MKSRGERVACGRGMGADGLDQRTKELVGGVLWGRLRRLCLVGDGGLIRAVTYVAQVIDP